MKTLLAILLILLLPPFLIADELEKAQKLLKDKKYDAAMKAFSAYLQKNPDNMEAHEAVQKIALASGKEADVLADYKAKYEKDPTALNGHLYGKLIESPSERETLYRKIRDDHPADLWGHYGLANALLDQDRLQEASFVAESGVPEVKKPAQLYYAAARSYRRMKEYGKAAEQARLAHQADPAEYEEFMQSYESIEVSETEDRQKKFELAKTYYAKYKDKLLKPKGLDDSMSLAELAFIYAEQDLDTMSILVQKAQRALRDEKPPEDGEARELYVRTRSSLLALQAYEHARKGNKEKSLAALKMAANAGIGPESLYFSAITQEALGNKQEALNEAIRAAMYPPPYALSSSLATELWKEIHGSEKGLEEAMQEQKKKFEPQRKQRVIAQMISEAFKDYTLESPDGKKIEKQQLDGKVVLLNFWAVWCPPCREELPHWNEFYAKHKDDPDVALLAVGDEPWETMNNYLKNQNFDFAVYRNEDYWDQFDVSGIPTLVVIDPKGKIRFRNVGFEKGMEYEETLRWQIEAAKTK